MVCLPAEVRFEGEGDMLRCGELLVAGYRFRSDQEAAYWIGELLEREVLSLELVDSWFYHLDTCLCPLAEGTVLYYPDAFTAGSRRAIRRRFPDAITVSLREAQRFVCNSAVIGRHVVMSGKCPMAKAELQARGYLVHEVDVSEVLKAGGGAKCLVLFLDPVAEAVSPAGAGRPRGAQALRTTRN